ncbi:TIGR04076 family protein [Caniella muris]|uniref:TIGR04076 family protein n=1 Tax=Caniella muris TaxID=2941502 RepID=UPI002040EEA5|nr:TIGR04076 family protein [Caniella muris]
MQHQCKVTVLEAPCNKALQEKYLADPHSGPCPCFSVGDEFLFERTPERDDYYHLGRGTRKADGGDWPCGEAWDAVNRYIYTALQGGTIMKGWTNDDRMMIACCNDGTRPVVFKIERIDIPETPEEEGWLAKQDFSVSAEDAYTG